MNENLAIRKLIVTSTRRRKQKKLKRKQLNIDYEMFSNMKNFISW